MEDILIIGTGIVGSFLARDLAKYNLKITIVDKLNDIANATTMANSAIIHTGYDPKEGTLKALLNVKGHDMYKAVCEEFNLDYLECGAFVVATTEEEQKEIRKLEERAIKRNIPYEILDRPAIIKAEPNISDEVIEAISFKETAVVYPWEVALALVEFAVNNGVTLSLGTKVIGICEVDDHFVVTTTKGEIETKCIINAAGCGAEYVANLYEESPYHIKPKKGEYFVLSKLASGFANRVIYPTPTKNGKGVLAVPTTHGNTLIGPNSVYCDEDDLAVTQNGLDLIRSQITKIVKNVPYHEIIRSYVGLRASGNDGDFYIKASKKNRKFIHVACIDSPGLASAPAISEYVIDNFISKIFYLTKKESLIRRENPVRMNKLSESKRNELIKENPLYGKIVCKCENISYQEIVDSIRGICGARTIKAVKKRCRPGMGKCQGGFCEVEVAKILAKELNIPLTDVLYDQDDSKLGSEVK